MDRPSSPLFVPGKSGVDADTQVVVGELFEFDLEVFIDRIQNHHRFLGFYVSDAIYILNEMILGLVDDLHHTNPRGISLARVFPRGQVSFEEGGHRTC